jgi:hypothetical protein
MTALATPCPTDALDGVVAFRVDANAQPGDAVPALARLLIDLAHQKNERETNHDALQSDSMLLH